jgi:methyl-accepting chemotaxis protein
MLKNIKINSLLWMTISVVILALMTTSFLTYLHISDIKQKIEKQEMKISPHSQAFDELKLDIVQIQQFLSDISATRAAEGFDDGLNEAKKYFQKANETLDYLIKEYSNEPNMTTNLQEYKKFLADYYALGEKMAKVYIKDGPEEGNKLMAKLDPYAEKLTTSLDKWVKKYRKENTLISEQIVKDITTVSLRIILSNLFIIILTLSALFAIGSILKNVQKIHNFIEVLAKLDFTTSLSIKGKNEIAQIADNLEHLKLTIAHLLKDILKTSNENATISHELSTTSLEVGKRVENSTIFAKEATGISKELEKGIALSIDDAKNLKKESDKTSLQLQEAVTQMQELSSNVHSGTKKELDLAKKIAQLSENAEQVKDVLTVISDIADQTNLLALNAAIEAARAGEHGRGFAVVADEVRKLAERTQKSLQEINATISVIVQSINNSSEEINQNSLEIQNLSKVANEVEGKILSTMEIMNKTSKLNDKSVQDYIATGEEIQNIVSKIENLNQLSSENARSIEEVAGASEHLNTLTTSLNTLINKFKI